MKEYTIAKLSKKFSSEEATKMVQILEEDIEGLFEESSQGRIDKIIKRITDNEPIQYITGVAPFYGYFFRVNKHVLIPRPETEELVYFTNEFLKKHENISPNVLDVGTGSGCIPISLSLMNKGATITSIDVSEKAINVASFNNVKMDAQVKFKCIDFLERKHWDRIAGGYDVIISNPPYIPYREQEKMSSNVLDFEPHLALFVANDDALVFYQEIFTFSKMNLNENGAIFLECNEFNAKEVVKLFSSNYKTELLQDMQGKDRVVVAYA